MTLGHRTETTTLEDKEQRVTIDDLAALEQIRRLFAEYCHRFDDRDVDGWVALFTPDARFVVGRTEHVGHDAIRAWADAAQAASTAPSRHLITNAAIDLDSPDEARSTSDFVVVNADRTIAAAGRYADQLRRDGGEWRLAERRVEFLRA